MARSLRAKHQFEILFLGDFGPFAQGILTAHDFEMVRCAQERPTAEAVLNQTDSDTLLIIDHYGVDSEFVAGLANARRKTVYFVDEDLLDYRDQAQALISIRLAGQEMDLERFGVPVFSGADFLVVNPDFGPVRKKHCSTPVRHRVANITLFLSGSEGQLDHELRLVRMLNRLAPQTELTLITSHVDQHRASQATRLHVEPPTPHMAAHLAQTDLLICGGGLLKYEAAFCGVPSAICSLVALQHKDSLEFCARGLAWDLGLVQSPAFEMELEQRLTRILEDHALRQGLRDRCALIFSEDSTNQLASELIRLTTIQD